MRRENKYVIRKRILICVSIIGISAASAAGITALAAPGTVTATAAGVVRTTPSSRLGTLPKETPANNLNFPFATDAVLPPTLAAAIHAQATERTQGYLRLTQNPARYANLPPMPTWAPTPAPRGIVDGIGGNEQLSSYLRTVDIANHWEGVGKDDVAVIIAGAFRSDATQGVIELLYGQRNSSLGGAKVYPTPTKHGSVQITAVNGTVFTLVAKDGTVFTFDRSTAAFK